MGNEDSGSNVPILLMFFLLLIIIGISVYYFFFRSTASTTKPTPTPVAPTKYTPISTSSGNPVAPTTSGSTNSPATTDNNTSSPSPAPAATTDNSTSSKKPTPPAPLDPNSIYIPDGTYSPVSNASGANGTAFFAASNGTITSKIFLKASNGDLYLTLNDKTVWFSGIKEKARTMVVSNGIITLLDVYNQTVYSTTQFNAGLTNGKTYQLWLSPTAQLVAYDAINKTAVITIHDFLQSTPIPNNTFPSGSTFQVGYTLYVMQGDGNFCVYAGVDKTSNPNLFKSVPLVCSNTSSGNGSTNTVTYNGATGVLGVVDPSSNLISKIGNSGPTGEAYGTTPDIQIYVNGIGKITVVDKYGVASTILDVSSQFNDTLNNIIDPQISDFNGSFKTSCKNIKFDGLVMTADCLGSNNNYTTSSLDTSTCRDKFAGNYYGKLGCEADPGPTPTLLSQAAKGLGIA